MIIPKFIIDQSIINAEIRVINSLLSQQRQLKQTLILYLEKISEGILNANDDQDSTSLVSCLNGIKMSFENIKGNIDTLLELRAFLEESSKLSAYDSKYFEKYNEDYIKIFEKISEDNIFYYTFMESILKYMSVVFDEAPPAKEKEPIIEDTKDDAQETEEEVIETYDFNLKDMVAEELLKETSLLEEFAAIAQATLEQFEEIQEKETASNTTDVENNNNTSVIDIKDDIFLEDTIINNELNISESTEEETKNLEDSLFTPVYIEELENDFDNLYENSDNSNMDTEEETFFDDTISDIEDPNEPPFIPEEITETEMTNKIQEELEEELNKVLIKDNNSKSKKKNSSKKSKKKKKQKDYTVIEDEDDNVFDSNTEIDPFKEKILLFSEKNNNIILPFSTEDLEEFFTSNPSKYTSMQDIIDKEYTLPFDIFKNPASARFKETYYLAKHKSNLSVSKATALASELYFNSQVDPVIIRACKNIDELYSYLACLERNHLEEFKPFKIIYN